MLAGLFPTSVLFRGTLRYGSAEQLDAALAAIQDLIDGEDDDVAPDLELRKKGCELRVRVETTCARDEYLAYETLIETLAATALDGEVTGEIDDTITTYSAGAAGGAAAATTPESKAAAIVVLVPMLACDAMLDLSAVLA